MAAHRYWRLFSVKSNDTANTAVCELEMFTSLGGTNVCTGGTAASSSNWAGWEAAKAFDGIKTGDQGWAGSGGTYLNQWVSYDFGVGNEVEIIQVAVTARSTNLGNMPNLFAIEWSDDGINWTQKGHIPPQTSWGANETRTFDIVNEISAEMSAVSLASRSFTYRINRPASFKKSTTGGDGSLGGTVLESSAPVQGAIITVFDETTHAVAGQGTTNILGDWVVDNINPNKTYFAVAKHPDDLWEMKISSRRVPSRVNLIIKPSVLLGEHSSAILTAVGEIADPHWANVVSLLHFDGADGSTTFTDEKGRTWTGNASAFIRTAQSVFGGSAASFTNTNANDSGRISTLHHEDFNFSTVDFTIEAWVFPTASPGNQTIISKDAVFGSSYPSWGLGRNNAQKIYVLAGSGNGVSASQMMQSSAIAPLNTWTYIAVTRIGSTVRIFINGVLDSTHTITVPITDGGKKVDIGDYNSNTASSDGRFLGYIDELRITRGVARYTANFTPPTVPFLNS